jgi:hypothetical protein
MIVEKSSAILGMFFQDTIASLDVTYLLISALVKVPVTGMNGFNTSTRDIEKFANSKAKTIEIMLS